MRAYLFLLVVFLVTFSLAVFNASAAPPPTQGEANLVWIAPASQVIYPEFQGVDAVRWLPYLEGTVQLSSKADLFLPPVPPTNIIPTFGRQGRFTLTGKLPCGTVGKPEIRFAEPDRSLPNVLGGCRVTVDGQPAFLSFLSRLAGGEVRIDGVLPTHPDGWGSVVVEYGYEISQAQGEFVKAGESNSLPITILPVAPAGVVVSRNLGWFAFPQNTAAKPLKRGEAVRITGTNFGETTPRVAPGTAVEYPRDPEVFPRTRVFSLRVEYKSGGDAIAFNLPDQTAWDCWGIPGYYGLDLELPAEMPVPDDGQAQFVMFSGNREVARVSFFIK